MTLEPTDSNPRNRLSKYRPSAIADTARPGKHYDSNARVADVDETNSTTRIHCQETNQSHNLRTIDSQGKPLVEFVPDQRTINTIHANEGTLTDLEDANKLRPRDIQSVKLSSMASRKAVKTEEEAKQAILKDAQAKHDEELDQSIRAPKVRVNMGSQRGPGLEEDRLENMKYSGSGDPPCPLKYCDEQSSKEAQPKKLHRVKNNIQPEESSALGFLTQDMGEHNEALIAQNEATGGTSGTERTHSRNAIRDREPTVLPTYTTMGAVFRKAQQYIALPFEEDPHRICNKDIQALRKQNNGLRQSLDRSEQLMAQKDTDLLRLRTDRADNRKEHANLKMEYNSIKSHVRDLEGEVRKLQQFQYNANQTEEVVLDEAAIRKIEHVFISELDVWAHAYFRLDKASWKKLIKEDFQVVITDKDKADMLASGYDEGELAKWVASYDFTNFSSCVNGISFNKRGFLFHKYAYGWQVVQSVVITYLLKEVIAKPFHGIGGDMEQAFVDVYEDMAKSSLKLANKWRAATIQALEAKLDDKKTMILKRMRANFYDATTAKLLQIVLPLLLHREIEARRNGDGKLLNELSADSVGIVSKQIMRAVDTFDAIHKELLKIVQAVGQLSVDWGKKLFNVSVVDKQYLASALNMEQKCPLFDPHHKYLEEKGETAEEGEECYILGLVAPGFIKQGTDDGENFSSMTVWVKAKVLLKDTEMDLDGRGEVQNMAKGLVPVLDGDGYHDAHAGMDVD